MTYSSLSVANAFIELARDEKKTLTNMQLQKLVFFSHGYVLAYLNKELTNDPVKAWTFGPVYPELYNRLRHYGRERIPDTLSLPEIDNISKDSEEMKVIKGVWNAYKSHKASQLVDISHNVGSPWDQIWSKNKFQDIPDNITQEYYKKLI